MKSKIGESRGILHPKAGEKKFSLTRLPPTQDLSFFVERYWIVTWDLRSQEPYVQETLPFPCVNLVFEKDASRVFGVETGRFSRLLEDKGRVFGIKFRPGAFYPFIQSPISKLTNTSISFRDGFGMDGTALEDAILSQEDEESMKETAEDFLRERLPEEDKNVKEINAIIDYIVAHGEIIRVDDLVSQFHVSKRTLQRLFQHYVGVSPKWVIQRYRLHEVAERLIHGETGDCTRLALELGYFDQAHFIKDFKAIVGSTPVEYAKHGS